MAALRYLYGSVTQGGADAFAQNTIATALTGATGVAYRLRELLIEIPRITIAAGGCNIEAALSRRTKAAMPNITDVDVIQKIKFTSDIVTSGGAPVETIRRFIYGEDDDVLIVEDPLYIQVDSNATSLTQTIYFRLGYQQVKISEVDRLTLLTQSLV